MKDLLIQNDVAQCQVLDNLYVNVKLEGFECLDFPFSNSVNSTQA